MTQFDPTIPETDARVQSEPLRNNFNALNERTNQLTATAQDPVGTGVVIGKGDKVYFEDNKYTPFGGAILDLGDPDTGVSKFTSPNVFKEIIIFYRRDSFGIGELAFLESAENAIRDHSVDTAATLIGDASLQRQADETEGPTFGDSISVGDSPLDGSIALCSVLVTNNGQTDERGAISPIFNTDIIDVRPFMQRTINTADLAAHKLGSLAEAHPGTTIPNASIETVTANIASDVINSNTINIDSGGFKFDPDGYSPIPIFISSTNPIQPGDTYTTTSVVSVAGNALTLSSNVTAYENDIIIRGTFTIDRMAFDLAAELSDVMTRDANSTVQLTGDTSGTANDTLNVGTASQSAVETVVDGYSTLAAATIANTTDRHTHGNKALLDTYTQTESDLAGTVGDRHTHTNKAQLDLITDGDHDIRTDNPHDVKASDLTDFDTEVDANPTVVANANHTADLDLHREIGDGSATSTTLWSSQKINSELGLKANSSHSHDGTDLSFTSALALTSGFSLGVTPVSKSNGDVLSNADFYVEFDSTPGIGPSLSIPSSPAIGQVHIIKDVPSGAAQGWDIVRSNGSHLIDGTPSITLGVSLSGKRGFATLVYLGGNQWSIIGRYEP